MELLQTKRLRSLAISAMIAATSLSPSAAMAAESGDGPFFGKRAPGKWIIGAKAAKIDVSQSTDADIDAAGVVLGYEFARSIGDAGGSSTVEFEYLSGDDNVNGFGGANVDINVANLFFTYRSAGTLYYKFKGGLSFADVTLRNTIGDQLDIEETGLAGGIGLGYRVGDLGVVELEYQVDASDADLGIISLSGLLEF